MKTLSPSAFDLARTYLKTHARPLDRALFEFHFEGAPAEQVLAALAPFQNPDGGFGHALEPDMRTPSSSALATAIGLDILHELGCPADHPMVQAAVHYLQDTLDPAALTWRVIPTDANDYPHAPWWHDEAGSLARTFDDYLIIPRARLVALLHHYAGLVPTDWLDRLTEATVRAVETLPGLAEGGGDGLHFCLILAEAPALPAHYHQRLAARLERVIPQAVSRTPEEWRGYSREPLKLGPSPTSLAAPWLADILPANLDFRIERQAADGAWDPNWSWSDFYPEAWEQARQEWRGELTLLALLTLRAYGRLEG